MGNINNTYEDVVPINWSNINTCPLTGTLAESVIYFIDNINRYIVNDWWNEAKRYNNQIDNEYLILSGIREHDIRSVSHQAHTLAVSIKLNIYSQNYTGVPKSEALSMAVKMIKSLAKAHISNTENGWGNEWQSAFWAGDVAHAGWLLWDEFSKQDKIYIYNTINYEADRFIDYDVPYYKDRSGNIVFKGDSKAEENAWNTNILSLACCMMPNHKHYNAWMHKNLELIISSFAVPSDIKSDRNINGFILKDILNGSNVNENGTVVNHDIIHPDYQTTIHENLNNSIYFAFAQLESPEAVLFNTDVVYKAFIELDLGDINPDLKGQYIYVRDLHGNATCKIVYPNGTDWGTDRQANFFLTDVQAYVFGYDKDCSIKGKDFALSRIPLMKAMIERNTTGQYYMKDDSDRYPSREEWFSWNIIYAYLSLWAKDNNLIVFSNESFTK